MAQVIVQYAIPLQKENKLLRVLTDCERK
jgi:hypothetical protein